MSYGLGAVNTSNPISAVTSLVGSLFGGSTPTQRPAQLATNAKLYSQALGGEVGSLYALGFLMAPGSTPFPAEATWTDPNGGVVHDTPAGGGTGKPWGDGVVQHDALNKYNAARAAYIARGWTFDVTGLAHPPTSATMTMTAGGATIYASPGATALTPALSTAASLAGGSNTSLLLLGAAAIGAIFLFTKKRRG